MPQPPLLVEEGNVLRQNMYFTLHALCALVLALPQAADVALRQIVLASEQEAREVRASLIHGAPFDELASQRSRDATASRGGYMGRMRLSDLRSEVRTALAPLAPGGISDPIRLGNTYVL